MAYGSKVGGGDFWFRVTDESRAFGFGASVSTNWKSTTSQKRPNIEALI